MNFNISQAAHITLRVMAKQNTESGLWRPYSNHPMTSVWFYRATELSHSCGTDWAQLNSWWHDVSAHQHLKLTNNSYPPSLTSLHSGEKMSSLKPSWRKTMTVETKCVNYFPFQVANQYWFEERTEPPVAQLFPLLQPQGLTLSVHLLDKYVGTDLI